MTDDERDAYIEKVCDNTCKTCELHLYCRVGTPTEMYWCRRCHSFCIEELMLMVTCHGFAWRCSTKDKFENAIDALRLRTRTKDSAPAASAVFDKTIGTSYLVSDNCKFCVAGKILPFRTIEGFMLEST